MSYSLILYLYEMNYILYIYFLTISDISKDPPCFMIKLQDVQLNSKILQYLYLNVKMISFIMLNILFFNVFSITGIYFSGAISLKFTLPVEYPDISPVIEIPVRNQLLSAEEHKQLVGFLQEKVSIL